MGRRTRSADSAPKSESAGPAELDLWRVVDFAMVALAAITVALVALWFSLDVNRVFDVPKALALKTGGCLAFLLWLGRGLTEQGGFAWGSLRLYIAPVATLVIAVAVSTLFSIDPWMSTVGVYERQFGLQGILACAGLFVVTASCLKSKRAAVVALSVLVLIGAIVSAHALLQSQGLDPWGFFRKPHNKVYATLGNATFAGNSLALIFPVSLMLGLVGSALGLSESRRERHSGATLAGAWVLGLVVALLVVWLPARVAMGSELGEERAQTWFKLGAGLLVVLAAALWLVGSYGARSLQAESEGGRAMADAMLAGLILGSALMILPGLYTTRTRGAWVGTAVALTGMSFLVPLLFRELPELYSRVRRAVFSTYAACFGFALLFVFVLKPDHVISMTVKSIPYAFMPEQAVYGQGQGTRPYLWGESPRVLLNHGATLERVAKDRAEYAQNVPESMRAPSFSQSDWLPTGLRKILVWPFGIGIETYRYAFMSHKSKVLEALDPMTNHDNPHNNYLYVLASCGLFGLFAYCWLLWRLLSTAWRRFRDPERDRADRAVAFGVVCSFFSYSIYSIAGFDSVACSVFLYFLLGAAATFLSPTEGEGRRSILVGALEHWRAFRGDARPVDPPNPLVLTAVAVALGAPLLMTISSASTIYEAETVFVAKGARTFEDKVRALEDAIVLNPNESFYRQSLGNTFADAARQYRQMAVRFQQQGKTEDAQAAQQQAKDYLKRGEQALYSALNHAWAPENIFISIFQIHYGWSNNDGAEQALERALEHSPHLGPVRANLAVLKLGRGGDEAALADALWVLDIDPSNVYALRTAGRSYFKLGEHDKARHYLDRAKAAAPGDGTVSAYLRELDDAVAAKSSTQAG